MLHRFAFALLILVAGVVALPPISPDSPYTRKPPLVFQLLTDINGHPLSLTARTYSTDGKLQLEDIHPEQHGDASRGTIEAAPVLPDGTKLITNKQRQAFDQSSRYRPEAGPLGNEQFLRTLNLVYHSGSLQYIEIDRERNIENGRQPNQKVFERTVLNYQTDERTFYTSNSKDGPFERVARLQIDPLTPTLKSSINEGFYTVNRVSQLILAVLRNGKYAHLQRMVETSEVASREGGTALADVKLGSSLDTNGKKAIVPDVAEQWERTFELTEARP